jgi:delta1-piperideine-2-carboxylate reductase
VSRTCTFKELKDLLIQIFCAHGFSKQHATILASNCAMAEADGTSSHGLFRMSHYIQTVKSGYANALAVPEVFEAAPGVLRADARNGFVQIAIEEARGQLIEKAKTNGIAVLMVRNSHHLGPLYLDIEAFADQGLVALAVVNSLAVVAPPGAKRAVYGTNPMAFAAPRETGGPIFFDQSSSTIALGEVQLAMQEGRLLDDKTGIDAKGNVTGSPQSILDGGALLTFGGHKGASIALMVEILCAALVGADFSYEVDHEGFCGAKTARTGETIILIDPKAGAGKLRPFESRVSELARALKAAGQSRVPGERRLQSRATAMGAGLTVPVAQWDQLIGLLKPSH